MDRFKALLITRDEATKAQSVGVAELGLGDLMDGDVDVRVEYSTVNYKDGLAITGKLPVVRRFPLIPGIDFAGTVTASAHAGIKPGDKVVLNGWGVGEVHHGGYSQMARVKGDWLIPLPARPERGRGDGDRHGRLHRDAGAARAGTARHRAGARPGGGDRRRRRRRLDSHRAARRARLHGPCGHRPHEQGGLPARTSAPARSSPATN